MNTGTGTDFTISGEVLSYDVAASTVTVRFDATSDDGQNFYNAPFPHDHVYPADSGDAVWWINDAAGTTRIVTFTTTSIGAGDVGKRFSISSSAAQQGVDDALAAVGAMRATLGAQSISLNEESNDMATASANLVISESAITNVSVVMESTNFAKLRAVAAIQSTIQSMSRSQSLTLAGTLIDLYANEIR